MPKMAASNIQGLWNNSFSSRVIRPDASGHGNYEYLLLV